MSHNFKVGQIAFDPNMYYNVIIKEIHEDGKLILAMVDYPDTPDDEKIIVPFYAKDLEPFKPRRFFPYGNHCNRLIDGDGNRISAGTWGIWDDLTQKVVFWVTSAHSRMIAVDMCKMMNENKDLAKKYTGH